MSFDKVFCVTALVETSPQALPLGSACIASAVKNDADLKNKLSVELCTFSLESKNLETEVSCFLNKLESLSSAFILFSVYVWNRNFLQSLAEKIKSVKKDFILIAGGPEVTANPFNFKYFDYAVSGEGEFSVPLLLKNILENNLSGLNSDFKIQGVYNLTGVHENTVNVRSVSLEPVLLSSPYLDGTLDPEPYGGALWELARGCPFKCSYCYESKGEKTVKYFPLERITKELEFFVRHKVRQVFVLDPTYNADKKRALQILSMVKEKAAGIFFYFEARPEYIDRELALAFASIPCSLQFGLQSSNEAVLKNVNRSLNKKLIAKNIGYLNQAGAVFGFDLIYGLPGDSFSGFKESIDYALSLYPNNLELFCLSVLPGTVLYEDSKKLGLDFNKDAPYNVIKNRTFSESDILRARELSLAVDFFYNKGRAVPWFLSVLYPLHIKPSLFLQDFSEQFFCKQKEFLHYDCDADFEKIISVQKAFIQKKYKERHLEKLLPLIYDIIDLQGSLSLATSCGRETVLPLNFHPDDLLSPYAGDILFFSKNVRPYKNRTKVFVSKQGVDWKVIK